LIVAVEVIAVSSHGKALFVQYASISGTEFDSPVAAFTAVHHVATVSTVTLGGAGTNVERHDLHQVLSAIPSVLDDGIARRSYAREEEERSTVDRGAGIPAGPVIEGTR
jgi:hypothetical protein